MAGPSLRWSWYRFLQAFHVFLRPCRLDDNNIHYVSYRCFPNLSLTVETS